MCINNVQKIYEKLKTINPFQMPLDNLRWENKQDIDTM